MRRLNSIVPLLLIPIATWVAVNAHRSIRIKQTALFSIQAQFRDLESRIKVSREDSKSNAMLENSPMDASERANAADAGKNTGSASKLQFSAFLVSHPDLFRFYLDYTKANFINFFGFQIASAGLKAGQISAIEDMFGRHEEEIQRLKAQADDQGLPHSDPNIAAQMHQADRRLFQDMASTAGLTMDQLMQLQSRSGFQAFQDPVDDLGYYAVSASAPLTSQQAQQLTQAMAAASPSYQAGKGTDLVNLDWDEVQKEAASYLTPPQLTALQMETQKNVLSRLASQYVNGVER